MTSPAGSDPWRRHAGRIVDAVRLLRQLTKGDLPGAIHRIARRYPRRAAVLFPAESGDWVSHGDLDHRAARTCAGLHKAELRRGDRVLLSADNTLASVVSYLALLRAGAIVVLANPASTANEMRRLAADSGARLALVTPEMGLAIDLPVPQINPSSGDPYTTASARPAAVGADEIALLAYTSGTTGEPKGVPLTHANLLSSIRAAMLAWRWRSDDVLIHGLPLSHQHGLGGLHAALLSGSRAVILPHYDPEQLTHASLEHAATVLFAVPTMYERLTPSHLRRLRGLRLAICGSAPLPPELARATGSELGQLPLERYGTTESGLDVSNPYDGPRRSGTVGLPLPGVELRIADEAGNDVPDGADGEVLLRGPQVFAGYWQRPEATAEVFHEHRWFRTGDIGRIDPETHYLAITGRKKQLIITGGYNVNPREVELALEGHPDVSEAAVSGVASPRWGEQVTAWIVAAPGSAPTEANVIAHTRRLLAAYKCPKRVFVVDRLPRNALGKLVHRELRPPKDSDPLAAALLRHHEADPP